MRLIKTPGRVRGLEVRDKEAYRYAYLEGATTQSRRVKEKGK